MNSEKVKEIKTALEFMMKLDLSNKLPYIDGYTPKQIAYEEIFNYINELESENEMLKATKDRLTFADRIKLVDNAVENKLKQFAEKFTFNLLNNSVIDDDCTLEDFEFDGKEIRNALNDTLKQFGVEVEEWESWK